MLSGIEKDKLKKGMIVEVSGEFDSMQFYDDIGKILRVYNESATYDISIIVEFEKNIGGHTGSGMGKNGHCWNLYSIITNKSYTVRIPALPDFINF